MATTQTDPRDLLADLPETLRRRDLLRVLAVSDKTLRRWVRHRGFPAPLELSPCCRRWSKSAVQRWLAGREVSHGHA
jgi:predicted DNA-binding transcriptional regulator AlpA